jgi:redox-sensing transcriptional repressor
MDRKVSIGVIATPVSAAQTVCDRLVSAGVRCILNFAPAVLSVPEDVEVRKVDLAVEMQILSFHVARRADHDAAKANGAVVPGVNEMVIR